MIVGQREKSYLTFLRPKESAEGEKDTKSNVLPN